MGAINPISICLRCSGKVLRTLLHYVPAVLIAASLSGCATRTWNAPLIETDTAPRYDFKSRLPRDNAQNVFVVLAFSGGGTRAAAFSYGVLKALRDTKITVDGRSGALLDQVDVISSVSGGSYTAAYYGLFGSRIFDDFEEKVLKRDVEAGMLSELLDPLNDGSLMRPNYNRGDLAAKWLDDNVFDHKTFSDMSLDQRPFVIINASDINNALTFSFIQQQFDFLCSNLNSYPVANAVMASSAVPAIFAPIAVRNYDSDCTERRNSWVPYELAADESYTREHQVARALDRYFYPKRMPVVRLLDGGITDNLGVRGSMMSPVAHYGNVEDMAGAFTPQALDRVTKVLVIVANAQVYNEFDWSRDGTDPSIPEMLVSSFDASVDILSTETVSLAKNGFQMWADRINARRKPGLPRVTVDFATLTFDDIKDPGERGRFNSIPTALSLPGKDVDDLEALAATLVQQSPDIQRFVKSLH
ncbi:MAG: patatin-like phospholipase family protein [Alphaproteobacteria bacterium]|nr:patatin-like phospholipase family protein [Alphaproteobacteria bacterium]